MKTLTTTLLSISIAVSSFANQTKTVTSTPKNVTVFLRGAQVNRTTTTTYVSSGTTEIKLQNLSPNIDANSIQVNGQGNFTIVSVTNNRNYLSNSVKPKEILVLEDSVKIINRMLDNSRVLSGVYKEEKKMILQVSKTGEKSASEIEAIANLYRTRLLDLNKKILKADKKENKLVTRLNKLQRQINNLNNSRNKPTSDIVITIASTAKTSAIFTVSYYVYNAGWNPSYEIRSKDAGTPIDIRYKANVYQNTGELWKDVVLTLSTGNPSRNNNQPKLHPWRLDFRRFGKYSSFKDSDRDGVSDMFDKESNTAEGATEDAGEYRSFRGNVLKSKQALTPRTVTTKSDIATEFKIDLKQTLESNNKKLAIEIGKHQLNADYTFYAAPKLDKDAFLLAKITGWEEYNLLSGNANIFYKGTYVGKSYINTNNSNDTLDISLGRDKDIKIERTKLKEFCKKKTFGTNKKETIAWEIGIRNNKNKAIKLVLEDQIPVSSNNSIEVETIELSGANLKKATGITTWELELKAAESKKIRLQYSVKYPANKTISNL